MIMKTKSRMLLRISGMGKQKAPLKIQMVARMTATMMMEAAMMILIAERKAVLEMAVTIKMEEAAMRIAHMKRMIPAMEMVHMMKKAPVMMTVSHMMKELPAMMTVSHNMKEMTAAHMKKVPAIVMEASTGNLVATMKRLSLSQVRIIRFWVPSV